MEPATAPTAAAATRPFPFPTWLPSKAPATPPMTVPSMEFPEDGWDGWGTDWHTSTGDDEYTGSAEMTLASALKASALATHGMEIARMVNNVFARISFSLLVDAEYIE